MNNKLEHGLTWTINMRSDATWHDGEQQVGCGLYTVRDIRQICAQARVDIDSDVSRQRQLRREFLSQRTMGGGQ